MQKHPVHYYHKDPETGVEMNFTFREDWGWAVSFPFLDVHGAMDYGGLPDIEIPWPKMSEEEQAVVDENYENLHRMIREEDDDLHKTTKR